MVPFGYLGSVCTRIGCPGDVGEETGYADNLPVGRIANRYSVIGGQLVVRPIEDVESEEQALAQAVADLAARVAAIEVEQEAAGIHKYTPAKARDLIDSLYADADTALKVKNVTIAILKKMVTYILK